ncbi:unnamed protein product [Absidia cylindrospora]
MPNVTLRSKTKINENNTMEVDEVKVESSTTKPDSPGPVDSGTATARTINQAMDDLVAVIPGNEKNKSRILRRAVQHIKQLVEQIMALREQNEQYRETNQQQQEEIEELKARLEEQQIDGHQQEQEPKPASHPDEIGESS